GGAGHAALFLLVGERRERGQRVARLERLRGLVVFVLEPDLDAVADRLVERRGAAARGRRLEMAGADCGARPVGGGGRAHRRRLWRSFFLPPAWERAAGVRRVRRPTPASRAGPARSRAGPTRAFLVRRARPAGKRARTASEPGAPARSSGRACRKACDCSWSA